nr:hypothetical protein [Halomonas elongata]
MVHETPHQPGGVTGIVAARAPGIDRRGTIHPQHAILGNTEPIGVGVAFRVGESINDPEADPARDSILEIQ